jgi:hypothetical protein
VKADAQPANERGNVFRMGELKRVGSAVTMLVICGTLIIVAMTMMLGHYNSLAHAGPKAVLDGAVIALLLGQHGRWRCLALTGVVYGLVLLLQVGVFYLLPVMIFAGVVAAGAGRAMETLHRGAAVLLAATLYELLAGLGAPIRIYFGTNGQSEPLVWGLFFAELPLRAIGAIVGVVVARRWRISRNIATELETTSQSVAYANVARLPKAKGRRAAAIRLTACLIACTLPMFIESTRFLGLLALLYLLFALRVGLRKGAMHAVLGLVWGWLVFGLLSYAWHQDFARVMDLLRTLVLRFMPAALSGAVLVTTVRPIDLIRLLRVLRVGGIVLIPLSSVLRSIPQSQRILRNSIQELRAQGHWRGPISAVRNPRIILRRVLAPQLKRFAEQMAETSS